MSTTSFTHYPMSFPYSSRMACFSRVPRSPRLGSGLKERVLAVQVVRAEGPHFIAIQDHKKSPFETRIEHQIPEDYFDLFNSIRGAGRSLRIPRRRLSDSTPATLFPYAVKSMSGGSIFTLVESIPTANGLPLRLSPFVQALRSALEHIPGLRTVPTRNVQEQIVENARTAADTHATLVEIEDASQTARIANISLHLPEVVANVQGEPQVRVGDNDDEVFVRLGARNFHPRTVLEIRLTTTEPIWDAWHGPRINSYLGDIAAALRT